MRGALRWTIAGLAAGLTLAPSCALAQDAQATTNAPAADTVGPRELQNFSLQGNVTRPADQPAATRSTTARQERPAAAPPADREPAKRAAEAPKPEPRHSASVAHQVAEPNPESQPTAPPPASVLSTTTPAPTPVSTPALAPPAVDTSTDSLAPSRHFSLLPWLLAVVALGAGGAFLFWRNRSRPAFAGGPELDYFTAPEAAPTPSPPARPPAVPAAPPVRPRAEAPTPPPPSLGIVSTSLRPWVEVIAKPLRCTVTDANVTIDFELELFNSGNAPARDVFIEAVVVNAGPEQDQELASFFSRAERSDKPIDVIPPLSRTSFETQVVTSRDHVAVFEAAGRQVFVPLLAFNAFYRRGSAKAQTSVAYLVVRDSNGGAGKMAPFRIDLGDSIFRTLGVRQLPNGVRR